MIWYRLKKILFFCSFSFIFCLFPSFQSNTDVLNAGDMVDIKNNDSDFVSAEDLEEEKVREQIDIRDVEVKTNNATDDTINISNTGVHNDTLNVDKKSLDYLIKNAEKNGNAKTIETNNSVIKTIVVDGDIKQKQKSSTDGTQQIIVVDDAKDDIHDLTSNDKQKGNEIDVGLKKAFKIMWKNLHN